VDGHFANKIRKVERKNIYEIIKYNALSRLNSHKMKKFVLFIVFQTMLLQSISAQSGGGDFLRNIGKIYSVVAVIAVIFIGIFIFLFRLDRKLTKLENHIKNE